MQNPENSSQDQGLETPADISGAAAAAQAQAAEVNLEARLAEMSDAYLRAKAETENVRRRSEEEIAKARKFAVESFADSLLPVADSLEASLMVKDASPEVIREGAGPVQEFAVVGTR